LSASKLYKGHVLVQTDALVTASSY